MMNPFGCVSCQPHKTQKQLKAILQACASLALNESYSPLFIVSTQAALLLQIIFGLHKE